MIEAVMSKRRILEIYLNVVEWGEGVFGAEAAAQRYFKKSAAQLSPLEAARLAVMLPRPRYFEKLPQSAYLAGRAQVIARWKFMLPVALLYIVIVSSGMVLLDQAGVARGSTAYRLAFLGVNVVLMGLLFVILDRGRLISPASSRLERVRLERLRAVAATRSSIAAGEVR